MKSINILLTAAALVSQASSHLVITYPGWRGNNLHETGRTPDNTIPDDGLGVHYNNSSRSLEYPYGMQWIYPCGGMSTSQNRTKWPVNGGAIAFQPGWFPGHQNALVYINLGIGTVPLNMSKPMLPVFQLTGPTNDAYPGTYCLPQVPLPAGLKMNVGDNATIQIVEAAVHGAALYSCVDITFAAQGDKDIAAVNSDNCFNSSVGMNNGGPIGQNFVYTAPGMSSLAATISISWTTTLLSLAGPVLAMLI